MDNWNYPPGSDTANAPWNAPDAYEGTHTCDECGREQDGYGIDGEPCEQDYPAEPGQDAYTCDGTLCEPVPCDRCGYSCHCP